MAKQKLTRRLVEAMAPGTIIWDSEAPGLCARRQRRDVVYSIKIRIEGRQRWIRIGKHGAPLTVDGARKKALQLLGSVNAGLDPASDRDAAKDQITVNALCDRYLLEYAMQHKRPRTATDNKRDMANHIRPLLGQRFVADVNHDDIAAMARAVRAGKTRTAGGESIANRMVSLLRHVFTMAETWGLRAPGSNPAKGVKAYRETPRERYLSMSEIQRLADALEHSTDESPYVVAAIKLLLLSGARRGEILNLTWKEVDFETRLLRLRDSKVGPRTIPLSSAAIEVLEAIPRMKGNPHVIPGIKTGQPWRGIQKPWSRIRARAELYDVHIHDLRHTFASMAVTDGASLVIVGKLLGHKKPSTTNRYSHIGDDPVRQVTEAIGDRLADIFGGGAREAAE